MKTKYFFLLLLIASCIHCSDVHAINKVKIVTIGGGYGAVSAGNDRDDPQKIVDRIIEHWKLELNKVLMYQPDLIFLTETCDRPSGLRDQELYDYYRFRKNQIQDFFASVAKDNRCYIAFGTIREENGKWYNSCIVLDREGKTAGVYNKNYPTVYEMPVIKPGTEVQIIECDFGRVASVICFDLNFDELRDRTAALNPDVVLFPSLYHGGLEQVKWAYSCRSFFVCSYGFLTDASEIRNPFGEVVATSTKEVNHAVATINLDRKMVHSDFNAEKLRALKRKYGDAVIIHNPGRVGVQMITSEHEHITAADMVKEFEIELLEEYFDRSKQDRLKNLQ